MSFSGPNAQKYEQENFEINLTSILKTLELKIIALSASWLRQNFILYLAGMCVVFNPECPKM